MRIATLTAIALLALSACVSIPTKSRQVVTTLDFSSGSIGWCRHSGILCNEDDEYKFRWTAIVEDGHIEICGIGRVGNTWMLTPTKKAMSNAWVEYQGKRILTDLSFFRDVGGKTDLIGSAANCQRTETAVSGSNLDVQIKIPATEHKLL